jgi:hypothetical protein
MRKVFTPQLRIPSPRLNPKPNPRRKKVRILIRFCGLGGQPQTRTRRVADQTQILDSETELIKSTFDVTVCRVDPPRSFGVSDGRRMDESVWLPFRLRLETNSWTQTRRCTVLRRLRNSDCTFLPQALPTREGDNGSIRGCRNEDLLKGIYNMGFSKPSKIQERALPLLLKDPCVHRNSRSSLRV